MKERRLSKIVVVGSDFGCDDRDPMHSVANVPDDDWRTKFPVLATRVLKK